MSDLLDLDYAVKDAADLVARAIDVTCQLLTNQHTGETLPWDEMGETQLRLQAIADLLKTALDPVRVAVEQERDRVMDGPDECDPHGFKYHPKA